MSMNVWFSEGKDFMGLAERMGVRFGEAAQMTGMSKSFLRATVNDPNPERRLKTVRINRRRLNRTADLKRWFDRAAT
jgi:hypothetical protein